MEDKYLLFETKTKMEKMGTDLALYDQFDKHCVGYCDFYFYSKEKIPREIYEYVNALHPYRESKYSNAKKNEHELKFIIKGIDKETLIKINTYFRQFDCYDGWGMGPRQMVPRFRDDL